MSRFSDAAFDVMRRANLKEISSDDLWRALSAHDPELTKASEHRKTPRTTLMRDLRKDERFIVGNRRVALRNG